MLKRLKNAGITVLVSTPYMDEASLCDRVALIQKGNILAVDTPEAVAKAFPETLFAVKAKDRYLLIQALRNWGNSTYCYAFGEDVHITLQQPEGGCESITNYLLEQGISDAACREITPTIEDQFINLMNTSV